MTPIFDPESNSLIKRHLPPPLFEALKQVCTDSGFTIEKAIASGVQNPDSSIGFYAGDAHSYSVFAQVLKPLIKEYHHFLEGQCHISDSEDLPDLPLLDPERNYIISTRIRVARSIKGFNFTCHMDLDQRRKLEHLVEKALSKLEGDLKGRYISLERETLELQKALLAKGLLFKKGDRFQDAAGINADFPLARGAYYSTDKQFRVWVNEEDHLRIMSLEKSPDILSVFQRLSRGLNELAHTLNYEWDPVYGYLNSCPTNIGTAMRASVHIRLVQLEKKPDKLKDLARKHQLQIRGTSGEKTKVEEAVFDISNRNRLGISENQIITTLHRGVNAIIQAEESLSSPETS